mgnify:CR=1 FL=1
MIHYEKLEINVSHLIKDSLIDFIMSNGSGEIWNYKTPPKDYPYNVVVSSKLDELTMPFLDYFKLKSAWIKTTCQLCGETYPIHKDVGYNGIRRYIFLQDQSPGQFFNIDGKNIEWNEGDIYIWDDTIYHCSANAGIHPKIALMVSGEKE